MNRILTNKYFKSLVIIAVMLMMNMVVNAFGAAVNFDLDKGGEEFFTKIIDFIVKNAGKGIFVGGVVGALLAQGQDLASRMKYAGVGMVIAGGVIYGGHAVFTVV